MTPREPQGVRSAMRRRIVLATPASLLGAGAFAATPGVDVPPQPGPPRPLVLPAISQHRLDNGLVVLVAPRPGLPLVTAAAYLRAGRETDPADRAGLSILTGNLLTKGSLRAGREIPAPQIAREAEALGGSLDVITTWRVTGVRTSVTTPKLDAALALVAEVIRAPALRADELDRARTQALDGLRVTMASPGDVAALAARRAFWGASAYGASMTPASLQRLSRAEVQAFHERWYRPQGNVLVLAGDIDEPRALELARTHFGAWRGDASEGVRPPAPRSAPDAAVVVEMPGAGQSGVVVAAPFAALKDADRRIGEVVAAIAGGGYSARLNQEIRIRRGLSYGAFGGGEAQTSGGIFVASAQTQNATALQVAQLMREQLLRLAQTEASADELGARQAALIGSFTRQLETTQGLADQVASQWFQDLPLEQLARYPDEVLAVTAAQVREFAERHWNASALRTVIAGDVPVAGSDGPRRIPLAALDLERPELAAN